MISSSNEPSSSGKTETEFVTFRPQSKSVYNDPSQYSTETSMLYEELDIYDEPLVAPI